MKMRGGEVGERDVEGDAAPGKILSNTIRNFAASRANLKQGESPGSGGAGDAID